MSLAPGSRLGPYEIVSPLGAGGMGEVFRARDTRLGREVAIKVLPAQLSASPEVRARFEREAKTASSLNHPHICVVYDVGREGDVDYLVMELVDGETLAARIERGPLPVAEVLRLGVQIADALDKAHRAGVVHRDLKPANIMLTRSGAKLMDFGLARATGLVPAGSSSSLRTAVSQSPTIAQPLTAEGSIVGTFQYMSPEQLEGREADPRSDLWSFGCVLYEMTTGRRAFEGRSQASLISSIMKEEPAPIPSLAPVTPPALDRAVRTCLAKDADERWQTASDLRRELQWIQDAGSQAGVPAPVVARRRSNESILRGVALVAFLAAGAFAILWLRSRGAAGTDDLTRLALPPTPGLDFSNSPCDDAISPDGRTLAIIFSDTTGTSWLYTWKLSDDQPVRVADTRGAYQPFWSPDSRTIAYFDRDDEELKKVPAAGGTPVKICASGWARGGSWGRDGTIVFAPEGGAAIHRVPASGGTPVPVTTLDSTLRQTGHRFPCFLPDGRHFVYVALPGTGNTYDVFVGSLDGTSRRILQAGSSASYAEPGWLLFDRDGQVMAQRFDGRALAVRGEAVPIASSPTSGQTTGSPVAFASRNGRLFTYRAAVPETEVRWLDAAGLPASTIPLPTGAHVEIHLSPDARRLAVTRLMLGQKLDVFVFDLARRMATPFGKSGAYAYSITWAPDGARFAFSSNRNGTEEVHILNVDGGGEARVLKTNSDPFKHPYGWSADGKWLLVSTLHGGNQFDLWAFPVDGTGPPIPIQVGPDQCDAADLSNDGRWVAFQSNLTGRDEIYLQSFPDVGQRVQVSTDGGFSPRWGANGKLYFTRADGVLSVATVEPGNPPHVSEPHRVYRLPQRTFDYDVAPDGRVLTITPVSETSVSGLIISNWQKLVEGK